MEIRETRRALCAALAMALALALGPTGCTSSSGGRDKDGGVPDAGAGGPDASTCDLGPGALAGNLVRIVYLLPSDRQEDPRYTANLEQAGRHLQLWLRDRMPQRTTFLVHRPPVEVVHTLNPASYYASNPNDATDKNWFFAHVVADGNTATGGSIDDTHNLWLYYIDADPDCGQATGWAGSVGVLPTNDLRGLVGDPLKPICPNDSTDPTPRCRWVGGMGVTLMGVLRVGPPTGCGCTKVGDTCMNDTDCCSGTCSPSTMKCTGTDPTCDDKDLRWLGYLSYPDADLSQSDIDTLSMSSFVRAIGLPNCQLDCNTAVVP